MTSWQCRMTALMLACGASRTKQSHPYRNHGAAGSSPGGRLIVVFSQLLPVWLCNVNEYDHVPQLTNQKIYVQIWTWMRKPYKGPLQALLLPPLPPFPQTSASPVSSSSALYPRDRAFFLVSVVEYYRRACFVGYFRHENTAFRLI